MNSLSPRRRGRGNPAGWFVLGVGLLALLGLFFNGVLTAYLWPFFIMFPGLALFTAVKQGGRGWAWLTVPASFFTVSGLVLLFTAVTGWWTSLAYLSALVVPGSIGLGLAVYGDLARKVSVAKFGEFLGKVGLGLSLLGAIFIELFLNVNGIAGGITGIVIAAVVILAGIFLLVRPRRHSSKTYSSVPTRSLSHDSLFDDDPLFQETPVNSHSTRK